MNILLRSLNLKHLASFYAEVKYILLFYVFGDFFTTMYALQYGFEENSILSFVIENFGIWSLLTLKCSFLGLVYYNYLAIKSSDSKWLNLFWSASKKSIITVGAFLVLNNLLVIYGSYSLIQFIRVILI
jgi:hypothetical protein